MHNTPCMCESATYRLAPTSHIDISALRPLLAVGFALSERQSPGEHNCSRDGGAARVPTLPEKSHTYSTPSVRLLLRRQGATLTPPAATSPALSLGPLQLLSRMFVSQPFRSRVWVPRVPQSVALCAIQASLHVCGRVNVISCP